MANLKSIGARWVYPTTKKHIQGQISVNKTRNPCINIMGTSYHFPRHTPRSFVARLVWLHEAEIGFQEFSGGLTGKFYLYFIRPHELPPDSGTGQFDESAAKAIQGIAKTKSHGLHSRGATASDQASLDFASVENHKGRKLLCPYTENTLRVL